MSKINPKKLLVEGKTERLVIPELMEARGVFWEDETYDYPVEIKATFDGVDDLLKPATISTELKESGREIIGIIVDANSDAEKRFTRIRNGCREQFPELAEELPEDGLIQTNGDKKLGIWLMPDNKSHGMLETFLTFLAPDEQDQLVQYAEKTCSRAKDDLGAEYREAHFDKAKIYTWLAWQDEPGRQLHQAVKESVLSPSSECASPFVDWFCQLFDLSLP